MYRVYSMDINHAPSIDDCHYIYKQIGWIKSKFIQLNLMVIYCNEHREIICVVQKIMKDEYENIFSALLQVQP